MKAYIAAHKQLGPLQGRDFLTLRDFTPAEIEALLDLAGTLKRQQAEGIPHPILTGKNLAMLFNKSSTRTRISFEVAINQLGGHALVLSAAELQIGRGETVEDTARVLSRYVDGFMIRTFAHDEVETLAKHADIPIINGLTDSYHPCQILADLLTVRERFRRLKGIRLAYIGDGNNVANSLLIGCAKMGMEIVMCTPEDYMPDPEVTAYAQSLCARTGAKVELVHNPEEAATGAHALYTDVWVSMGQEEESAKRRADFTGFQINGTLQAKAHKDVIILHCLPAHRGEEITGEVIDGSRSAVFDQAENRLHAQKALLACLMR